MPQPARGRSILRRETLGFSVILLAAWGAEIAGLPHLLYADSAGFNWPRMLLRSTVILATWAWVHFTSRRVLQRLDQLEDFLLVCSWCRKVGHEGEWLTMEEYFGSRLKTETSHGICPACATQQLNAPHTATRVSKPAPAAAGAAGRQ